MEDISSDCAQFGMAYMPFYGSRDFKAAKTVF